MFLETALKNFALEIILEEANDRNADCKRFDDIFFKLLTNCKQYPTGNYKYKKSMSKRMNIRNKIYNSISRNYEKRLIVKHYYDKGEPLPIWAIFELLSLGEFGDFISCLDSKIKRKIATSVGIKLSFDKDGDLVETFIYVLKDLRNAVAHNNTIFDTRFKSGKINHRISSYISQEINISNITFNTIVDYVILISFLMKLLECDKNDIILYIDKFEEICESLRQNIPNPIYSKIIHTDTRNKIKKLKNFL